MIPILIRSRNRVDYLNTTLKSLLGSNIKDSCIIIADDCSDDEKMNEYLFSNKTIKIENKGWLNQIDENVIEKSTKFFNPHQIENNEMWMKYVGEIPYDTEFNGIKDKFSIIQPKCQMGDLCGLYWTIIAGFELFRNADRIIILEDDVVFNKNWFNIANYIYERERLNKIGLISVYNRDNDGIGNGNLYKEINNIGGVMYLIPRTAYDFLKKNKLIILNVKEEENIGGDVHLQNQLLKNDFKILNTNDSYIQHIGIRSSIRPGRFLRLSRSFMNPISWSEKL
jgi:hypothetical protein